MSKKEGFRILATHNAGAGVDNVVKAAEPNPQSVARRRLTDISNLPQKIRPLIQDNKSQSLPTTAKAYIEQLQKENMALVKMLAQRNKIIEQSGLELERLRLNLIKAQEQNQQLALSHTQMIAELNLGKDRLKALQHELGCKNGLLKARKLEGGEPRKVPFQSADEVDLIKLPNEGETLTVSGDDALPRNTKRRLRSLSCGSSEPLQSEENAGNRRPFGYNFDKPPVRRQSARFKAVKSKSVEDPPEKIDAKIPECPLHDEQILENGTTSRSASENLIKLPEGGKTSTASKCDENPTKRRLRSQSFSSSESLQSEANAGNRSSVARRQSSRFKVALESSSAEDLSEKGDIKLPERSLPEEEPDSENGPTSGSTMVKGEDNKLSTDLKYESQENGRSSLCRPSRLAAKKVQSYKEIPVNVKMRRSE